MPRGWLLLVQYAAACLMASAAAACPEHLQFLQPRCEEWQARLLPASLPESSGNTHADDEAAAALGMRIFYDNRFSRPGSGVACVNCHVPEQAFTERKATSHTIRPLSRNSSDLLNAAWYTRWHFWDGKVDNLWSAPLFTFEQDDEMGSTRLHVVRTMARVYASRYERAFGPVPDLSDATRFPPSGKPGEPQYDAMSGEDKKVVDRIYANIGKALEAYVRKLAAGRSQFDDFLLGSTSISNEAKRGMTAFTRYGCGSCHSGPTFTDERFHRLGLAANSADKARSGGQDFFSRWQFSSASEYADKPQAAASASGGDPVSSPDGYRTPSLRNVTLTAPYGHDGAFNTLDQAIAAHARILPGQEAPSPADKRDIIEFLRLLGGTPPRPPWNYWPGG